MRADYEQTMAEFQRAWLATKDPAYFREAFAWAHYHRQPIPPWLFKAGDAIAAKRRTKGHNKRHLANMRHLIRYETVRDFRAANLSEDAALDAACKHLEKIGFAAARPTIEDSYDKIKRELKANRSGHYQPLFNGRFGAVGEKYKRRRPAADDLAISTIAPVVLNSRK